MSYYLYVAASFVFILAEDSTLSGLVILILFGMATFLNEVRCRKRKSTT